jgi:hypothetical protein
MGFRLPIYKFEPLNNPQRVTGWTPKGLQLTDGRVVLPKGMRALPKKSEVLTELIRRGVEVDREGCVYGQVDLWHWCGNDPVWGDVRRVNIANVLAFLGEGTSFLKFARKPYGNSTRQFSSMRRWSISDYDLMEMQLRGKLGAVQRLN